MNDAHDLKNSRRTRAVGVLAPASAAATAGARDSFRWRRSIWTNSHSLVTKCGCNRCSKGRRWCAAAGLRAALYRLPRPASAEAPLVCNCGHRNGGGGDNGVGGGGSSSRDPQGWSHTSGKRAPKKTKSIFRFVASPHISEQPRISRPCFLKVAPARWWIDMMD